MALLNRVLGRVVDFLLEPFDRLSPFVGLGVVSLATAIVMLMVVKRTSNQPRIAAVKRAIHAGLFEVRLFSDDLPAVMRAQGDILRHNLTYLRLSLVPMLWIIVPLVLIIAQLEFYYGYTGLAPGSTALVKVLLKNDWQGAPSSGQTTGATPPELALEAPAGVRVSTPAVWIPSLKEADWRIAAVASGRYDLTVKVDGKVATKTVLVSDDLGRRSPIRVDTGLFNQLLYPSEPPLQDDQPVESITVTYPERDLIVMGYGFHWMVVFFVLSMAFSFALKNRFKVVL